MRVTFISALLAVAAVGRAATELESVKQIYDTEVAKVEAQFRSDLLRMPQEHIRDLRELEQVFQRAGDLRSLLAVQRERTRFTRDPRADAITVVTTPTRLANLQSAYIKVYGELKASRDFRLKDLTERYLRRLALLQRELTMRGEITDAMEVMKEIERMKTIDVLTHTAPPGMGIDTGSGTQIGIETLRNVVKGKIVKWNSQTREIVLEYDFVDAEQVADWKGGELDGEQTALLCANTIAWLRPQFESITEVEVDAQFREGSNQARVMLGNSLFVDLINDDKPHCVVFQMSEHTPVLTIEERLKTVIGNQIKLQFGATGVFMVLNYSNPQRLVLQTGVRFPAYLGVGLTTSTSAYGDVKISGILTPAFVQYVREQGR